MKLFSRKQNQADTYKVGATVPEDGLYICVPCGNKQYLKAGERFGSCLKCLGKDWRLFRRGLELWEKIHEKK
ncbi:hypothetical protein HYS79_00520 [Patescibacteria group bacterium]|nr:hypothetical protein [Patescibacteria group bacterium]